MSARHDSTARRLDTAKARVLSRAMPDAVLLRTERLTRAYGSLLAVSDVDVSVQRGELRSIIGPNGAGKTTFFRLISGETVPTAGMSPEETDATMRLIRELATGRTVVLVEHKMKVVMGISDRITVLHQGQVLADGTPEEIRANTRVQQTYLGATR